MLLAFTSFGAKTPTASHDGLFLYISSQKIIIGAGVRVLGLGMSRLIDRNLRLMLIIVFVVFVVAIAGNLHQYIKPKPQIALHPELININGTILKQPRNLQDFTLTDHQGRVFTKKQLQGHWTLMFFGFSHCSSICPTTLSELDRMYQNLQREVRATQIPQIVMVSLDPSRDSIVRMNEYVKAFNPDFIGLTGDKEQVDALAKQMNVVYMKLQAEDRDPEHYTINHSGAVMLINPLGQLEAFLTTPLQAKRLVQDYHQIMIYATKQNI